MKYYIVSDIHGFYTEFHNALVLSGFFDDVEPHKLVVLGDLFDRGHEAKELQNFVLDLMEKDEIILIRGNHEDLFVNLVTTDGGVAYKYHKQNGTYDTALQLTDYDPAEAFVHCFDFAEAAQRTPYFQRIIPAMKAYFETENYVFVHGWIPCVGDNRNYSYISNWREASPYEWEKARWYNGIDAARTCMENKTIVCGHWHTSYGHAKYQGHGSEFGDDADFSPYYASGIIAVDACTAHSKQVNIVVLND